MDLCGPSIPRMLQVQGQAVHQCDGAWLPVYVDVEQRLSLMSVGFLLERPDEAVVWRGPKKNGTGAMGWYTGVGEPTDRASLDHRECPAHRPVCVLGVGSLRGQPDLLTLRKGIPALC